jgi:hypothetical protein
MDTTLQHLVLERLTEARLPEGATDLMLAACLGTAEFEAVLEGTRSAPAAQQAEASLAERPPGTFLRAIGVQGFRGVGRESTLELNPGAGLTLVVGRNGSGKSSFAEGLELLMTGTNSRWVNRTRVWTEGWQNLHFDGETRLSARLQVEGRSGLLELERVWPRGATLGPSECRARRGDGTATTVDELAWPAALSRYRPFLSYNELGSMFDELKTMYDALASILGLEDIDELARILREARLARERASKDLKVQVSKLVARLDGVDDDRAATVVDALTANPVDLDAIARVLGGVGGASDPGAQLADLRALCALPVPELEVVEAAFEAFTRANDELAALAGTDAARASSLASLLEAALRHDEAHADADCPVCGTREVIDDSWRAQTTREVRRLSGEAQAVEGAKRRVAVAGRTLGDLLPAGPPAVVARARQLGLDPVELEAAWERWTQARARVGDSPASVALREALGSVVVAANGLSDAAEAELDHREDVWRPVAQMLAEWLPGAGSALEGVKRLRDLKAAEAWIKETAADLQAQRLAPIADAAKANWDQLRQGSNVSLDGFHLRRSGNARAAEVDVNVDGSDASAFGVMSQGELHALAVSVFLPRAALPESPFRFMVIDDPVQSMDPAKVDGLARVLHEAAISRQVVVFTHDERLPEAVRRLDIPATVVEVTRRPQSIVEVRTALDPIERYLEDARALVRTENLPDGVAERVVPGFCRQAIEAACVDVVRRRRLGRGDFHADVDAAVAKATTLYRYLALALFDDASKSGEVLAKVNARYGRTAGDVVIGANKGVHELLGVDLRDFVRDSAVFARQLAEVT